MAAVICPGAKDASDAAMPIDVPSLIRPRRKIVGMSAILLPFNSQGDLDWPAFRAHAARTQAAGLIPGVNMDTGYVNLLDEETRLRVLAETQATLHGGEFVAGAFVGDQPGARFDLPRYQREIEAIQRAGGMPVIFQSHGLTALAAEALVDAYRAIGRECPRFLAFELGQMFAPFGRIYDLEIYGELLAIRQCVGAKHSSLNRELEWQRLMLRDLRRPDFMVLTGNDLAIDMVMYGSDYLLGLSTFAPDLFARRDALWLAGDPRFYELNDVLQYLGCFAFRSPVPAYKHNAAQFLKLRGWIDCDATHPKSLARPETDCAVLEEILERIAGSC
jgi:dihydrodipicolinate synthase/N-acetylneuraminate lyase